MPVYKDKTTGKWYSMCYYTDWKGNRKQKCKRGFSTKKEAQEWEREFQKEEKSDPSMTFATYAQSYEADVKPSKKRNTWQTKEYIIRTKILPYFGKRKLATISPRDIVTWQNEMRRHKDENVKPYSPTYLRTMNSQLSAMFNHAVKFYGLKSNLVRTAGNMGEKESREMLFWTKEEFQQFIPAMMEKPMSYYAFEMLYWTGIREGELLALTPADFDFDAGTVKITKNYQRIQGEDIITTPKTKKSNRVIKMPRFLCDEMQDFIKMYYSIDANQRMFPVTKHYLKHEMQRGCKETGVKGIRIHDIRHSHISLLIDMGFSALAIGDRVGHEAVDITYHYAHLFPSRQVEMADRLDQERSIEDVSESVGRAGTLA